MGKLKLKIFLRQNEGALILWTSLGALSAVVLELLGGIPAILWRLEIIYLDDFMYFYLSHGAEIVQIALHYIYAICN